MKVVMDPVLQARVLAELTLGRSPRTIAGRLAAEAELGLAAPVGARRG